MPIVSPASRNKQAKAVCEVHGSAESNPSLAPQTYERLGAGSMIASWCNSGHRDDEHCMMSGIGSIDREMGRFKGWRAS
jgi:hypothetical protein